MFRYRLRTLLIGLATLPPILAPLMVWGWREYNVWRDRQSHDLEPGYLGVAYTDSSGGGVIVKNVRPGCAAESAGLMVGDVITAVNNRPCPDQGEFFAVLDKSKVGGTFAMTVNRNGQETTVDATLRRKPSTPWVVRPIRITAAKPNP
jgi:S1-C subfamily serine protease